MQDSDGDDNTSSSSSSSSSSSDGESDRDSSEGGDADEIAEPDGSCLLYQVLARRVLSPEDIQAPRQLAAQQHWSTRLAWPWPADAPVAGYRLLVLYP